MNRKLFVRLAPLLAIAAFALLPAAAQAWQWYSENVVIPSGPGTTPVTTKGTLTFHVRAPSGALIGIIKCKLNDKETVFNKAPFGFDEVESFVLSGCRGKYVGCPSNKFVFLAKGLPPNWFSKLVTASNPPRDEIENMELEVKCGNGAVLGTLTGSLTPEVAAFPGSFLQFGPGSGTLSGPCPGCTTEITGQDKLKGPPGDVKISAGP
jgi:hypothetical protein